MRRPRSTLGAALFLALAGVAAAPLLSRLRRSWPARVAVQGHSMEPVLRAGDWLLVDPHAFRRRPPRQGELVVARDPRAARRLIVKRVAEVLRDGRQVLAGDHPAHGPDLSALPAVELGAIVGRPWLRYWPPRRIGPVD